MTDKDEPLPPEGELALAHTAAALRAPMRIALALDQRLGRIAGQTSEVMLGQMRLAWWRDMLKASPADRPQGDAVLDAIGAHWKGREEALGEVVDAWEILVASESMEREAISAFARGRAAPFAALAGEGEAAARAQVAGMRWALADAAGKLSDESERARFLEVGLEDRSAGQSLPRALRGLAVLEALALRAMKRGGRPLMEGRGAALTAMRAAILGR